MYVYMYVCINHGLDDGLPSKSSDVIVCVCMYVCMYDTCSQYGLPSKSSDVIVCVCMYVCMYDTCSQYVCVYYDIHTYT